MKSGNITAVHQDTKNKHRYHLYVEDEFAFSVHEDILIKYSLFKGTEIDEAFCNEVLFAEEKHRAVLLALRYLGIRPRTAFQLERYLIEKGFSADLARETRGRCEQQGYINDESFSKQWVNERLRLKQRSTYVLRMELHQRGVSNEIVNEAVKDISFEDEMEAARKLVTKRLRHDTANFSAEAERKLIMMLMRKGFSNNVIQKLRRELQDQNREE